MTTLAEAIQLEDQGQKREAAEAYGALASQGNTAAAHNLALMMLKNGDTEGAAGLFAQIIERTTDFPDAMRGLAHCRIDQARVAEGVELFRRAGSTSEALFYSLHLPGDHGAAHAEWARSIPQVLTFAPQWPPPLPYDGRRPIRVGYVGVGLIGTVARFLNPVLKNHDPAAVQVFTFGTPTHSELAKARLDVVVDLIGHMSRGATLHHFYNRLDRPAPLICSYIGYPHATGLPGVYRITDAVCDPDDTGEPLIRLPGCCWAFEPDGVDITPPPSLANGFVTFGSLNRACKIAPEVSRVWGQILGRVPGSRLLVLANGGERNADVRKLLMDGGVPGDRLKLAPSTDRAGYLKLINSIDVALDPWPYAGMTTTCDLLWQGVPVVTLAGDSARSRAGASLLKVCGQATVAATVPEYIELAARCAESPFLDIFRSNPSHFMFALCDGRRVAANLEAAYREILCGSQSGQDPHRPHPFPAAGSATPSRRSPG